MDTKVCIKCGKEKDIKSFYKRKDYNGYHGSCKECIKEKKDRQYAENKKMFLERNYKHRVFLAVEIDKLKNFPCKDCGIKYEPLCMDFDHLPGTQKIHPISLMIHETCSLAKIKEEISKCELVCVLCHKLRTDNRRVKVEPKSKNPRRLLNRIIVDENKNTPCAICKIKRNPCQMEFDHLDGSNKKNNIAHLSAFCYSEKVIIDEISKCRILCCLCHRRETARRGGWRSYDPTANFAPK